MAVAGFRVRVIRNDGLVIYDSITPEAKVNYTIVDQPGAGDWRYDLQVIADNSGTQSLLKTADNAISIIRMSR